MMAACLVLRLSAWLALAAGPVLAAVEPASWEARRAVLMQCLRVMGLGMLGIFVFMALFAGLIVALGWLFPQKPEPSDG